MPCQQFPINSPPSTFRAGPFNTLVECEQECCSSDSGSFSTPLGDCQTIDLVATVTNSLGANALLTVTGSANDEVLIDGAIYEAGQYGFYWSSYYTGCGSVNGDNGAHSYSYSVVLAPNASVTFGGKDNGFGGDVNGTWTLETCYDAPQ